MPYDEKRKPLQGIRPYLDSLQGTEALAMNIPSMYIHRVHTENGVRLFPVYSVRYVVQRSLLQLAHR